MTERTRIRFAAAAVVALAVLGLTSCEIPGFLGDSFDISDRLYAVVDDVLTPVTEAGTTLVRFSMAADPDAVLLFSGVCTDGMISAHISAPAEASLRTWAEIMPPITLDVSDASAKACVINSIDLPDWPATAEFRNVSSTQWVFWAYSDMDVTVSASGATTGPGGASVNMDMNIELKEGWNLIVLDRTGSEPPFTDTYSISGMPEGIHLISDIGLKAE